MRRWDRLVERYLEAYAARGVSAATLVRTRRELDRWGNWLKRRRPRPVLEPMEVDLLVRYIGGRGAFRSKATVRGTITVMRGFGEFLVREGIWSSNPLRWMRGPKVRPEDQVPRRIGASALGKVLECAVRRRSPFHRHLWLAVIAVLYGTGIRRGELIRLRLSDWRPEDGLLQVDGRKTGRPRQVPVPALTARCLAAYLPQRHNHLEQLGALGETALFVNQRGARCKETTISRGVQTIARRAGLDRLTLHQFRHTCASDLLEEGVRLPEVQRLLGHQTITTTVRYLHIADPQRHAAVRLHPVNAMLSSGGAA
jgi:site-specific recombinase XerD